MKPAPFSPFFSIAFVGNGVTEMLLYGSIAAFGKDSMSAAAFAQEFKKLEQSGNTIHLRINSPGGSVFEGLAIFNTIRRSKSNVIVFIDGMAASMATVIAMAGAKIYMSRTARFMTHRASGYAEGDADSIRTVAEQLEALEATMASIYAEKTGLTIAEAKEKYLRNGIDRWLSADEALKERLIDGIFDSKASAPANEMAPEDLWRHYAKQFNPLNSTSMKEQLIALLGLTSTATDEEVIAAVKKLADSQTTEAAALQNMINMAHQKGRIDKEKKELFSMLVKDNPGYVREKLTGAMFSQQPMSISAMVAAANQQPQAVGTTTAGKKKSEWTLDDYRKYAPGELQANAKLYNDLLEKEGITE